ncbi:MAG TPA: aminotransferase class III-fold pyridoxal phosphate-dependent enzyme [Streptosporangiaceae bacterium]|nr:aminotransferase class III-fold pyridoxal phosphate-dependent enzyme [Streptosporangiaceae bacterium]
MDADSRFVLHSLRRDPCLTLVRGENARLWDADGRMYLDTMSGSAGPAMVGHANPRVAEAVARQMAALPTTNILHQSDTLVAYCTRLAGLTPEGLTKIAVLAGGGEAIEAAVKLAMRVTGRTEVLSLHGAYHGMSLATMGLAGIAGDRSWLPGAVRWPTFRQVPNADTYRNPLGDGAWEASVRALESALDGGYGQVAAFVMEIVQGPGGHVLFPPGYYQAVQRACRQRGVLLIVDEIQTGLARCGTTWACDLFGVRPDILVAGKALGGGVPIGVVAARADLIDEAIESEPWNILTFMNQPLAAAAGLAVLDIVAGERLAERAGELGARATERFRALAGRSAVIGDVRGPGLFVGIDYVLDAGTREPATAACADAWQYAARRGLLCQFGGIGGNVLKFKPPLTTPDDDFEQMLELVEDVTGFIEERVTGRIAAGV